MRPQISPEELARRSSAVLSVLNTEDWSRPLDIAKSAGLPLGVTKATLKRLLAEGSVKKRRYEVKVMRGATRKRITSKPIVEYQAVTKTSWPEIWLPRAMAAPVSQGIRVVKGRCGCSD